ncbi:hypothetical protein A1O1_09210 [Capronia coronata CBS 617.96]|uniref:Uncharacterized protein n=1 Tax=Capronia coronata CBS 617.96 TaxID=1182541 RepID=W9XF06_9EURO|nr:uncharacterized protein A1O1_09210 [Capronia coronata CBS 617.96]EXJ78808.1 hypothetical protein A1O1_09210 [Capronia coronata CBS 617.96]
MGEPSTKRQKTGLKSKPVNASSDPQITDPRFANIQSDPRYRLPGKKDKVKLDKRFTRALQDEDFTRRAKVDRYGRPIAADAERSRLKRKYEFEDEEAGSDVPDKHDEVQEELHRLSKVHDPLREGRDTESSSDETTSSDDESDEDVDESAEEDIDAEAGVGPTQQTDVPTGEVTSRIAIVNLDWDNIRAADLMAVFSSFLPSSGSLLKVAIYPSEFGKERLEREELEGPPQEIFATSAKQDEDVDDDDDDEDAEEAIKKSILKSDDGADFDSKALRRYQLERLRYFYCILTFSSPEVAKHIYDAVDGTEYQRTANFFDLRFVPDETDFSSDVPREECDKIPDDYRPNDFVTDALQHSKVKLTWDAEDKSRKEAVARAFKGSRKEIEENDLKAYLGSDTSDDEDEVEVVDGTTTNSSNTNTNMNPPLSKKEAERQRMRALLGLAPEPEKKSKKEKAPVGDMLVTFTSGLAPTGEDRKKRSVFENSPEPEETTVERYIRKERERKQKRKERRKTATAPGNEGSDAESADNDAVAAGGDKAGAGAGQETDLGFDDPFFADEPSAKSDRAASTKMRKEERMKKKREREAEEEAERKQRAELELLMADDSLGGDHANANGEPKLRHFDMKEIEKAEKLARKKNKNKDKKRKDKAGAEPDANGGDEFKVDAADPRFARLFTSHEYAIDPTNPRFKGTKAMKTLLQEGRRMKEKKGTNDAGLSTREDRVRGKNDRNGSSNDDGTADVKSLVEKIKQRHSKK